MSLTEEQLQMRRGGITATDASAIVGVNRFSDALAVYLSKVDPAKLEERKAENPLQKGVGHRFEPLILDMVAEEKRVHLVACGTLRSAKYDWALATPDRLVVEPNPELPAVAPVGVAEVKNVGIRMIKDWREQDQDWYADEDPYVVPDYVHVQAAWQMLVTDTRIAYVGALLGGRDFHVFEVHWNDALAETLVNVCGDFWHKYVLKRVAPPPAGNERAAKLLATMFPKNTSSEPIEAPGEAEVWAEQYLDAKAQAAYFETLQTQAENQLKLMVGSGAGFVSPGWKLTWKTAGSGGTDWKGLATALAGDGGIPPELLRKFARPGSRRFLLTKTKQRKALVVPEGGSVDDIPAQLGEGDGG